MLTWDTFSCIIPQSPARISCPQRPSVAIPVHDHCPILRVLGLLNRDEAFCLVYSLYAIETQFSLSISIIVGSLCLSLYCLMSSLRESTFPYSWLNPLKSSIGLAHAKCLINICQFENFPNYIVNLPEGKDQIFSFFIAPLPTASRVLITLSPLCIP